MILALKDLSRPAKRLIFLAVDTALIPIMLYCAFVVRYGTFYPWTPVAPFAQFTPLVAPQSSLYLFPVMTVLGAGLILLFRLPQIKLNAFETRAMIQVGLTALSLVVTALVFSHILGLASPRSVAVTFGAFYFIASISVRVAGLSVLTYLSERATDRVSVAIYGAGSAGMQMAAALRQAREARPVLFVDDNITLQGLIVAGLPVHNPARLPKLVKKHKIGSILIALPSAAKERQKEIIGSLKDLPVEVKILPSYVDMMAGNGTDDAFRPVTPDALLNRDKVDLDTPEINKAYAGRVVMVTGAGGSIGSELCRQLLNCQPERIVLFEQGEFQLYSVERALRAAAEQANIPVVVRLGSVTNAARVRAVIAEEKVDIILHAAAYKHVPLIEDNEMEGARNNVLGTRIVAEAAAAAGVERMVQISTDKAVRPSNIMGATKQMAELVVQDIQTRHPQTKFAIVRFGNVLGSSGSVLPLFQSQIAAGGPVTVTDPRVTRFFMTIPEATRLVLLAGGYAIGGDVFVLDMGEPQTIIDMARKMIALSGRTVKDKDNKNGDIEIKIIGLRPGEKLYEELLIADGDLHPTPHPKILRSEAAQLPEGGAGAMLEELQACLDTADEQRLRTLIANCVDGYRYRET